MALLKTPNKASFYQIFTRCIWPTKPFQATKHLNRDPSMHLYRNNIKNRVRTLPKLGAQHLFGQTRKSTSLDGINRNIFLNGILGLQRSYDKDIRCGYGRRGCSPDATVLHPNPRQTSLPGHVYVEDDGENINKRNENPSRVRVRTLHTVGNSWKER